MVTNPSRKAAAACGLWLLAPCAEVPAGNWPSWRGPEQSGVSRETGLPDRFSLDGENVVWRQPHGGRSTPVVMNGRVYVLNRSGSGATEQERVMCFDAEGGNVHWQHAFNVYLTDIPSNRVGWASPAGDPETGNIYVHGVQGMLLCLDRDGKVVWRRSLHEEYGKISGYGGRTTTPVVDGDLVIVSFLNSSWGAQGRGGHRWAAFDKRTGAVVWWSEPGKQPRDTTYAVPAVAVVNGVRVLIDGGGDGAIHAMKVSTGEKVWDFQLSEGGLNASVVVSKDRVYACHGDENADAPTIGRVVCIDATGKGDVTKTHEKWRLDGITAGYSSPALHDGKLYVIDNAANVHAIEAETGGLLWKHSVGTVMKSSPVVADGKIYVAEVNSRFVVLKPSESSCATLCEVVFPSTDGTVIEVNGSAAVANGRVYFATRDETYCIGLKGRSGSRGAMPAAPAEDPPGTAEAPAHLQVTPADVVLAPGSSAVFTARLFDSRGRFLRAAQAAWSPKGLKGLVSEAGKLVIAPDAGFGAGTLEARAEGLAGEARVRVVPAIPFAVDFEALEVGKPPPGWNGAGAKFAVASLDGQKVLKKLAEDMRFTEAETFFGLPTWRDYTVQADVHGVEKKRQLPDMTLVNCGYQLTLFGNQQRLQLVSWKSTPPRLQVARPFAWKPGVWYRMKLRHGIEGTKGLVRGKVWPRDEAEPEAWSIEVADSVPTPSGSPAIQAYSAGTTARGPGAEAYFDNVQVMKNEP
ncbi:MAG: PQQ-binding-like beta-propeller repeat protein [Planctomycetes bacterium]|nr:PQQ-binding-like beta-propeller repeat protein [Planctomycetota bacterium]